MDVTKLWQQIVEVFNLAINKFSFVPEISVIFLILIVLHYAHKKIISSLEKKSQLKNLYANAFFFSISKPGLVLIWFVGLTLIVEVMGEEFARKSFIAWLTMFRAVVVDFCLGWVAFNFIKKAEANVINPIINKKPVNITTVLAIARLSRVIITILIVLFVLSALQININGVLAIGSAGTIVAGIAAKDLLANFFGGFMVFMDRPFAVGDWILSPDKEIEGTVEHIGWRVTRIRRFDKRPLYVQNSLFLTLSIENPSRMHNRRIKSNIGIRYNDVKKIPTIINEIDSMLKEHLELDHEQATFIIMNKFGDSSLDCMLYCFTKTVKWIEYLQVQQDVLLKAAEIIHKHGADIAYPTTTLDIPDETLQSLKAN